MDVSGYSQRKILLVDDDPNLLVTVGQFLRFEGYDVTTVESGEEALEALNTLRPNLIILDMSMPGMGGVGFLQRITDSEGKPRYPVLVLTARAQMAEFFANLEVDGFIAKPAEPDDLLAEVGRILFLRGSEEPAPDDGVVVDKTRFLLLGDPDEEEGEGLVKALKKAGYNVARVASGAAVLEQTLARQPDAVLLRAVLPDLSAGSLVRLLRGTTSASTVPVVVFDMDESGAAFPPDDLTLQEGSSRADEILAMLQQLF